MDHNFWSVFNIVVNAPFQNGTLEGALTMKGHCLPCPKEISSGGQT
jgi:hypothetical protein